MIVLASAKTMKPSDISNSTKPIFKAKSQLIRENIAKMSIEDKANYFKIKGKTLENTHNYFLEPKYGKVVNSLDGAVFKQITANDAQYIENNLFILDAMYGILNGNDQIELFRLDFNLKSVVDCSYYNYWKEDVNNFIETTNHKQLLILSSDEYTKLLDTSKLNKQIFELSFDKQIKSSVYKKQLRGKIANYCIENKINDYTKLDNIILDNYKIRLNKTILEITIDVVENNLNK